MPRSPNQVWVSSSVDKHSGISRISLLTLAGEIKNADRCGINDEEIHYFL